MKEGLLGLYLEGAKRKGYLEQAKQMVFDFYYNRKFSKHAFAFYPKQKYNQNDFRGSEQLMSVHKDNFQNQPARYYDIFTVLKFAEKNLDHINLLDIGCGNGRVLVAGISRGLNKVIGIDVDADAVDAARKNCLLANHVFENTAWQIDCCDAATFEIPGDVNLVMLFNPFGQQTLQTVVANLLKSYTAHPRPFYLVYGNPQFTQVVQKTLNVTKVYEYTLKDGRPDLIIYKLS